MAIINCVRCGNVFSPETFTNICPDCVTQENKDLRVVTDYLRSYPMANVMEVSDRTGVQPMQIFRFVKSGSLRITAPTEAYKCRMCGKDVKKGTLCQDCHDKVAALTEKAKKLNKR
jgi:ribosomal protein L32